jgi:hypothetical protein
VPTLAEARTLLSRYVGANNDFEDRLNLVRARLLQSGNWRNTKAKVTFNVFPDSEGNAVVTLPRSLNTILAGMYLNSSGDCSYGYPLPVRNSWYSFTQGGSGYFSDARYRWSGGIEPEEGWFRTFADWSTPKKLRLKFAATETNGLIFNLRGVNSSGPIYTGTAGSTIEGENLTTAGATTLTTTSDFSEPPYALAKPVTFGRVSMYTWDGTTETLVAIYDPTETVPMWRRYLVPGCANWTEADPGQFLTICKRAYVPVANDYDEVIPGNLGALRFGLQALLSEDAKDGPRAREEWATAEALLTNEVSDDEGAGAQGSVQVDDTFGMATLGELT